MSQVKKVLSIDMDYIMGPSIQLYNDCAGNDEFKQGSFWEKVNQLRGVDEFLKYDEKSLLFVEELFARNAARLDPKDIFFATEHDMILEFLCGDEAKKDFRFDIYNVDHHHDIFYNPQQKSEVDRFDFACIANWVYYLGQNRKIEKYHWVANKLSQPFPKGELHDLIFPADFNAAEKKDQILGIDFDYVFVCRSKEYFPDKFKHFFELLRVTACGIHRMDFAVWNKEYCEGGRTRHVLK